MAESSESVTRAPSGRIARLWAAALKAAGPLLAYGMLSAVIARVGDVAAILWRFLLGRWLTPEDFGAIDPFIVVMGFMLGPIGILTQTSIKSVGRMLAVGEKAKCAGMMRDLSKVILVWTIVVSLIILALRSFVMTRLHLDSNWYVALLLGLTVVHLWQPFFAAVMQGAHQFVGYSVINAAGPFVMTGCAILLVGVFGWGLPGALAARLIAPLFIGLWMLRRVAWIWQGPRESYADEMRLAMKMWIPVAIQMLAMTLLGFDRLFVRNFMLSDSGGFAAVLTLGQIPMWLIAPITTVLFPMASAEVAGGRSVSRLFRDAVLASAAITLACAILFRFAAVPLMRFWNPVFAPYADLVWLCALAFGLQGLIVAVLNVEMARHAYGGIYWMAAVAAVFCYALYRARGWMDLPTLMTWMVGVRVAILAGLWSSFRSCLWRQGRTRLLPNRHRVRGTCRSHSAQITSRLRRDFHESGCAWRFWIATTRISWPRT